MKDNVKGGALTEVSFLVLLSLYEPRHGYGVLRFISAETGGRVKLGAGTLYGAISTLQKKGWIALHGETDGRKIYAVTPLGKEICAGERERLSKLLISAERIMNHEKI